jgi:hypothetical protein
MLLHLIAISQPHQIFCMAKVRHTTLQISRFSLGMWACHGQISAPSETLVIGLWEMIIHPRLLGKYGMLIYYKLFQHVRVWQLKLFTLQSHNLCDGKSVFLKTTSRRNQRTFVIMSGSEGKPEPASGIWGAAMPIVWAARFGLNSLDFSSCEDDFLIMCQVAISCTHFSIPILLSINSNLIFRFILCLQFH